MKKAPFFLTLLITLCPPLLYAEIPAKLIAFNCYSCHGEKLSQIFPQKKSSKNQLINKLLHFKRNKKENSVMNRISKGYSEDELKAVAHYLSQNN